MKEWNTGYKEGGAIRRVDGHHGARVGCELSRSPSQAPVFEPAEPDMLTLDVSHQKRNIELGFDRIQRALGGHIHIRVMVSSPALPTTAPISAKRMRVLIIRIMEVKMRAYDDNDSNKAVQGDPHTEIRKS